MKKFMLVLLVLTGCSSPEIVSQKRDMYLITDFDPPKHVYVDLERVSDKVKFEHVYVSKHFNDWREIDPVGKTISLNLQNMKWGDSTYTQFSNVREAIEELK